MKRLFVCLFAASPLWVLAMPAGHGPDKAHADKQRVTFKERFNKADVNHDGKLTLEEAKAGMPKLAEHFARFDLENKGYVTLEGLREARKSHHGEGLAARFNKADADHDGKLTLAEAQAGMPRVAKHFDRIDTGHQGYVTLEGLRTAMQAHHKGKPH